MPEKRLMRERNPTRKEPLMREKNPTRKEPLMRDLRWSPGPRKKTKKLVD
jgi:hypothetical protein